MVLEKLHNCSKVYPETKEFEHWEAYIWEPDFHIFLVALTWKVMKDLNEGINEENNINNNNNNDV